jgi:catechol 2,3-dioxygenase-like lactoylglutathione lyase family enzyme
LRFDHVGVIVDDIDAATAFFVSLGFTPGSRMIVEGDEVSRINGLEGVRAELTMISTPDGSGTLEIIKYHTPADREGVTPLPANRLGFRHIALEVNDVHTIVNRLRTEGYDLVGEVQDYGDSWRLVYVRGPEGLIVELAENLSSQGTS